MSLHSTARRGGRSGLTDVVYKDNVVLELIKNGIYPWEKLGIGLGNKVPRVDRTMVSKKILMKWPSIKEGQTLVESSDSDVSSN